MKPREWWAVLETEEDGDEGYSSGAICSDGDGNLYWQDNQFKVIEKSAFEKLEAERDTLKAKLAEVEAEATSLKDQLAWSIKNENMYKAETHTALINLERMREQLSDCGALYEGAKVMREAWRQSLELFTPNPGEELTEYGEGAKQTIEQMREQYEEALAKADEMLRQGPKK